MALNGWIILDKPLGLGSTQAVSAVKRALRQSGHGKAKVGHGGTLDPLATGVLPVALGEATKLAGRMLDSDKIYDFTIGFGEQTDTLDGEGQVIATSESRPTWAEIEAVLPRFTGDIEQAPPAYSAILIDGQRAYDLARAGEAPEMKRRAVTVRMLQARHPSESRDRFEPADTLAASDPGFRRSDEPLEKITLTAHVSKGTYIRSLARDIALALGTVGHVTHLRRVKAGPFTLSHAISLDKLADAASARALEDILLPLRAGLDDIPALALTPDQAGLLRQGQVVIGIAAQDGLCFATLDDVPVALAQVEGNALRVVRGFNL